MTTMTIAKAINEGLRATLAGNPRTLLMGEDIGPLGGVYRVTEVIGTSTTSWADADHAMTARQSTATTTATALIANTGLTVTPLSSNISSVGGWIVPARGSSKMLSPASNSVKGMSSRARLSAIV